MPTQSSAVIDKILTNVSNQLAPTGYISEQILPELKVKQYSGKIANYGNGHLRIVSTVTGGKSDYAMVDSVTRNSDTYQIETHALKDIVTAEDLANVEKPYDAEQDVVTALTSHLMTGKEKSLADTLTSTSIITQNTTLSGTAQFSDYTNSDPLAKLKDARLAVRAGCGFAPDAAILDWSVAETLRFHPQLLDVLGFKHNRPNGLNDSELARALNVRKVLIAEAVYNSAKQGQADVISPIWGKHIVFAKLPDRVGLRQKSLGYRVQLSSEKPRQVFKSFPDEPVNSRKIMVLDRYDQILTDVDCAYLIADAIA